MSNTTYYRVICACGHEGKIRLKENDTPYSGSFWERYSLEDLNGVGYYTETSSNWETILSNMNASCPKCNASITPKNIKAD